MSINTFTKRQASHQFGRPIGVRSPTNGSTAFLRATTIGLYHKSGAGVVPAGNPSDGWSFGSEDRIWRFGDSR